MQRVVVFAETGSVFSNFFLYFMLTRSDCGYRERKCADTIGTVMVPMGWPFPLPKYKCIFLIKYMEAISIKQHSETVMV